MSSAPPSVPLPKTPSNGSERRPVWSVTLSGNNTNSNSQRSLEVPLHTKCDRHSRDRKGVCCKDLKGEERHLVDPVIIRDAIIGLSDGLTVPFALAAGLSSLGESRLVVLAGIAELIAGSISMGVGGFLAAQSERDHYRYLQKQTAERVLRSCDGEMEREVYEILGPVGVDEQLSRKLAKSLLKVEMETNNVSGLVDENAQQNGDVESSGLRWSKDVGLTAFLLKFGAGLEEVPTSRLYISAFTIGMGYFVGGLIPLTPYFFIPRAGIALMWSVIVTGITLLVFGVIKTHVTGGMGGWRGYVYGALSTLAVGGTAAAASYVIVAALEQNE